jgi:hypothetical protein
MSARATKLVVAAIATTAIPAGFAQSARDAASIDPVEQLVEQIAAIRAEKGPTPVDLIDPLHELALLYESDGDHALAIVALEEARHVTRVHQGLSAAGEAVLLREQIRNEKALGNDERVWDLEQQMVTIARQHYDDVRMVPVFRELAEDRADALEQYRAGIMPPEIYAGCYYVADSRPYHDKRGTILPPAHDPNAASDGIGCRSGQSHSVVNRLTAEVLEYYADAIETMLTEGDYASQELRDLEKQMFRTRQEARETSPSRRMYMISPSRAICWHGSRGIRVWDLEELLALDLLDTCLEPVIHDRGVPAIADGEVPVGANRAIWAHLVRSIAYEIRSDAPAAARASAIAELADWLLASTPRDRRRYEESDERALELYGRAYRELEQDPEARTSIFSPQVPVVLPTYEPNPFTSAAAAEASRYIDVSFDITKHGWGERVEILATSRGATRVEERELIRSIESANFRPRFVDGELADAAPVVLRYHLRP